MVRLDALDLKASPSAQADRRDSANVGTKTQPKTFKVALEFTSEMEEGATVRMVISLPGEVELEYEGEIEMRVREVRHFCLYDIDRPYEA